MMNMRVKPDLTSFVGKSLLLISLSLFLPSLTWSQALWQKTDRATLNAQPQAPRVVPFEGTFHFLAFAQMVDALAGSEGQIELPTPDGASLTLRFRYSPVYDQDLHTKYPVFRTFKVWDERDPSIQGRIDHTLKGFHAVIRMNGRMFYIDPVFRERTDIYASYFLDDYLGAEQEPVGFQCDQHLLHPEMPQVDLQPASAGIRSATQDRMEYRIAIATTGEYANFHGGTKPQVLSELVTALNRINDIYENDLGVRLKLIANNDQIIFLDPATDGFSNGFPASMINENPGNIGKFIPLDDYDIGHVFGTATAGGTIGLASLASVCTSNKARAMSSYFTPENDPFYISVVCHELGHQFSARHSFNKCDNMNENPSTGWEPGSGSTIMSYAGACGTNDVQAQADPYFHGGSIAEMKNFIAVGSGSTCGNAVTTGNEIPEISLVYVDGFHIPISTPIRLQATAIDANNDNLTYCWEQMDTGPITDAGNPVLNSPLIRTYLPASSSVRTIPQIFRIVQNLPLTKFELLPTYNRDMSFRVTVRDNNAEVGAVVWKDVSFRATNQAGPFTVSSFNIVDTVFQGEYVEINWDKSNTDLAPVNCKSVNIRLSTDGGFNTPFLLAENVPNTGSFKVTMPKITTTSGRVQVEAADNIFFDISNANLRVLQAQQAGYTLDVRPYSQRLCLPDTAMWTLTSESLLGFAEEVSWSLEGSIPVGATYSFSQNTVVPPAVTQLIMDLSAVTIPGTYDLMVKGTSQGGVVLLRPVTITILRSDFSSLDALAPQSGASGVGTSPLFSWVDLEDAERYTLQVATSPAFGSSIVLNQPNLSSSQYQAQIALDEGTLYFWRVIPENSCGKPKAVPVYAFHTFKLSCDEAVSAKEFNIPAQGVQTIQSEIDLTVPGTVGTLRVKNITGNHSNIGNLRGSLKGPGGKTVRLFNPQCFTIGGNINFGVNDDSQVPVSCPPDKGENYKSEEKLSSFSGDALPGKWTLVLEDVVTGAGGKLTGWKLEYCSNAALNPPIIAAKDTLIMKPGTQQPISGALLLATDPDNSPSELTYTVVEVPGRGELRISGSPLPVGGQFTQQDILDGKLTYLHGSSAEETDRFLFTVQDPDAGWAGIESFPIRTDANVSRTEDPKSAVSLQIWPNPAQSEARILLDGWNASESSVTLFNVLGEAVPASIMQEGPQIIRLGLSWLPNGVYTIQVRSNNLISAAKLTISR